MISRLKREPEHILRNGVHLRMIDQLHNGDILTVILQEEASHILPNPKLFVPIVYEDDDLILFDKPAFMPVHPSIAHYSDTLANYFAYYMEQNKHVREGMHDSTIRALEEAEEMHTKFLDEE